MDIEVDQSGKIEHTNVDTVLAFGNGITRTILLPAKVKRECLTKLRKQEPQKRTFVFKLFAAALFLLLEPHVSEIQHIVIDVEYPEHESDIKGALLRLAQRRKAPLQPDQIHFSRIGKKSSAHVAGITVFRCPQKADKVCTAQELLKLVGK